MLLKTLAMLLAAELATSTAIGFSPQIINLDATKLKRGNGCASPGVTNGQCGRYYRNEGCNDQIGSIDPGVSLCPRAPGDISVPSLG
ncbi:uncharacterized protein GGS25DRAFT_497774 [Hypoxylon fragiforme]|uniref:uncharacterized protein n=1 Tax=Hypoxylon fragiforme TaxID=63214 RepID=UPI0020C69FC0|nr:uncharacterized protein GGS25DRAFT_497774 [Hypoxylon fragiforme]KAI2605718.1 hypothetical protein GGS25DRAFT_497774 [Hypoxylon fragiforme]